VNRFVLVTGASCGIGAGTVDDADLTTREGNRAVVDAALERFDGLAVTGAPLVVVDLGWTSR